MCKKLIVMNRVFPLETDVPDMRKEVLLLKCVRMFFCVDEFEIFCVYLYCHIWHRIIPFCRILYFVFTYHFNHVAMVSRRLRSYSVGGGIRADKTTSLAERDQLGRPGSFYFPRPKTPPPKLKLNMKNEMEKDQRSKIKIMEGV